MEFSSYSKTVFFLKQPCVVDFCKKFMDRTAILQSIFEYDFTSVNNSLLFLDASFLSEPEIMQSVIKHLAKELCICIIPVGIEDSIRAFCERTFNHVFYFPGSGNRLLNFYKKNFTFVKNIHGPLNSEVKNENGLLGFFQGNSEKIQEVRRKILKASENNHSVLLLGETGTGKSTAAKVIHQLSERKDYPFQFLNVPRIVDTLASSELFGTEKGAYTDAIEQKGIFRLADKGSLVLEEMGLATSKVQSILLQILESGVLKSVGSDKAEQIDVRMIYTTNSDMEVLLKNGTFRQDLYYRISDQIIRLPSLRERKEDIRSIIIDFLAKNEKQISETAILKLENYDWPGNIRELCQCLKRAVTDCEGDCIQEENINFGLFGN